jgi:hypothetical membrane protein
MFFSAFLIIYGILLIAFGTRYAFRNESPTGTVGAFLACVGTMVALVGVLLLCVPRFFT